MRVLYLDHNSTTPLLPQVAAAMAECAATNFGNPASQHQLGRRARQALENAREDTARLLGASVTGGRADRLIFTSGGTEANNLFVLGMADVYGPRGTAGQAIVSAIEHPSLAGPVEVLERRGWMIHRLGVTPDGVVDLDQLDEHLSADTRFVSVMLANNETGVLQPVAQIARRCAALGVPLHTDAAQIVGKLPVDFQALGASAMTVAAHKFHGPLGVGALLVRHDLALRPLLHGGFQQEGMRPGTEAVALAVGMRAALADWQRDDAARTDRLAQLRDRLEAGLREAYRDEIIVNGAGAARLPNTSSVAFVGLDRQAVLMALDQAGVAASTGSACASGSSEPSSVLVAMGCSKQVLAGSLRFSLGATTTADDVEEAIERIAEVGNRLLESNGKRTATAR
jgi:cysteine desulfurase